MAYSAGNTILDDHYNGFVSDINSIWGTASGNTGYGQGSALSSTSAGATITATQWETMLSRLETIGSHQNTAGIAFSTISAGNTISALADLSGDISTCTTNRGNLHAHGADISASSNNTSTWVTHTTFTATANFADDTSAKEFFNSGGLVGINFTNQGGGSGSKDTGWGNLISAFGTVWLTSAGSSGPATNVTLAGTAYQGTDKKGGSGSVTTESNTGFYNLTGSYQETFKQYDATYLYTTNYITCRYLYNSGTGDITIEVKLFDNANTSGNSGATQDEIINLNIQCNLTIRQPSLTYISNSWGTPTATVTYSDA
jgi:hypothetical protein